MSLSSFQRACGLFSMIGGLLFLILPVFYEVFPGVGASLDLIGMVFLLFGIIGIYLFQINAVGVFGFITFIFALVGTALWTAYKWAAVFVVPVLEEHAPELLQDPPPELLSIGLSISLYTFFIGWFLFSLVTAWKAELPRWGAILLVLATIVDFIPYGYYASQPLAGIGFLWLGYTIWKKKSQEV